MDFSAGPAGQGEAYCLLGAGCRGGSCGRGDGVGLEGNGGLEGCGSRAGMTDLPEKESNARTCAEFPRDKNSEGPAVGNFRLSVNFTGQRTIRPKFS
jgi:hypothetical protein